jgi:hypothetical protein
LSTNIWLFDSSVFISSFITNSLLHLDRDLDNVKSGVELPEGVDSGVVVPLFSNEISDLAVILVLFEHFPFLKELFSPNAICINVSRT